MSFFDKFMNALGFASNSEVDKLANHHAKNDDLPATDKQHNNISTSTPPLQTQPSPAPQQNLTECAQNQIAEFWPSNQQEIMQIIAYIKSGQTAKIGFDNFQETNKLRAMDFLQGACFALDICPNFEDGCIILGAQNQKEHA